MDKNVKNYLHIYKWATIRSDHIRTNPKVKSQTELIQTKNRKKAHLV
jgi:hypothetical protein